MATIIPLTSDYLKQRVYINLDAVRSFAAKPHQVGTILHFIDGKDLAVVEPADEIYQLAGKLEFK
jgi:hypothetical protein